MRCDAKLMLAGAAVAGMMSLGACAPVDPGFGEARIIERNSARADQRE